MYKSYWHSTLISINKDIQEFEFFDPSGRLSRNKKTIIFLNKLIAWIDTHFRRYAGLESYKYLALPDICPYLAPQKYVELKSLTESEQGFCTTYTLMYAHMRLKNPELTQSKILEIMTSVDREKIIKCIYKYNNFFKNAGWLCR